MRCKRIYSGLYHRIENITRQPVLAVRSIQRGYSPALRLSVTLADGSLVFVKVGTTPLTAGWLRQEYDVYAALKESFMPRLLGWEDDDQSPLLILEDLSPAVWPPPWTPAQIELVQETLSRVASSRLAGLPRLVDRSEIPLGWQPVVEDPAPFLSLGLATEKWLTAALPRLLQVNGRELMDGNALLHTDVRSDNLCFLGERAILVDWNWACLGNPVVDLAFWLPSLEAEGGPPAEAILPGAGDYAAIISGFFASKAGLPIIPDAPHVRTVQRQQLETALPWAVSELDLPPLDGSAVLENL